MMRRFLSYMLLFFVALMLPIGCSGSNQTNVTDGSTPSNVLSVYNWSTYIAPEVITQFEKEFNAKVKYDTYENNEALYAKIQPGNPGYDVAFPGDYMVEIMANEGLLEELNLESIPNKTHLDSTFISAPYDPENRYSLPYQWGTLGIGYNVTATNNQEIDSWAAMFEPKYAGRTAWLDEMRYTTGAVLMYLGFDPNTTNPAEIQQARDFLVKHKDAIAAFVPDTGQILLDQGEVDLTYEWSGDIFQVMEENDQIRYTIPKEGTIVWTDNMVILKNAPNKELAERFINFILEPEVGAKISNFIHYGSPNKTARDKGLINEADLKNPAIYPPPEVFAKLKYINDVGQATPLYDEAWNEVKVAVGK
ncbi:spermidine/putrescine ABC transporter substrate-binding protein [Gloeocapsa sp. BRSZ]